MQIFWSLILSCYAHLFSHTNVHLNDVKTFSGKNVKISLKKIIK